MNSTIFSFLLTTIAGLSTMLGTIVIFVKNKRVEKIITASLAFASGVMLTVSITDLIPESLSLLNTSHSSFTTILMTLSFIIIGIIISMLIDYYLPDQKINITSNNKTLYKVGVISMLAIILHNIPEGIATFITRNSNLTLGISLTIAIALHNIPEGISISVPIYYSTGSKLTAIKYTLISALSEPLGAIIAFLFLAPFVTNTFLGILFAIIAGIMTHISLCELLPTSKKYQLPKLTSIFFLLGSIFMLINILI